MITNVLDYLKIDYKVTGEEASARCPFHDDSHPSWSVNVRSGLHHCFSCGARGNLASLVSHVSRVSYADAVIWLNTNLGWAKSQAWIEDHRPITSYAPESLKVSESDMALFTDPPEDMIIRRNITLESSRRFGVRWNQGHESWIFPVREPFTDVLWGWQEKNERIFRNYPAGVKRSKTLFGLSAFEHDSTVIIVESPVDAVRLDACGYGGGLSSWGVQVSDRQLAIVQQLTESVILALDNDSVGISGAVRICTQNAGFVKRLRVFNYGKSVGKDPGELSDEEVRYGIDNAIPAMRYRRKHDTRDG